MDPVTDCLINEFIGRWVAELLKPDFPNYNLPKFAKVEHSYDSYKITISLANISIRYMCDCGRIKAELYKPTNYSDCKKLLYLVSCYMPKSLQFAYKKLFQRVQEQMDILERCDINTLKEDFAKMV